MRELLNLLPPDAVKIALVLLLSFFIGLEREQHKINEAHYAFGGIRTFPLIGLVSYALALISGAQVLPWALGFALVGGLLLLSYHHKLVTSDTAGATTEISGLATYVVGALVFKEQYWIASTVAILSVLLLELKLSLEGLTKHVAPSEVVTFTKFLVLTVVVLPIIPNREFTAIHLNPFKTWLVIVAVSGVSYGSYVAQLLMGGQGSVMLSAILGGAYSSTVTTIALARQAKGEQQPNLYAGSIVAASGMMYARLVLLLGFFNHGLAARLALWFTGLALLGGLTGWLLSERADTPSNQPTQRRPPRNPLELKSALLFGLIFLAISIAMDLARQHLGRYGLYGLAAIMGVTDVDPFILGLTQAAAVTMTIRVAASAIIIAAASNNVVKAIYAYSFADRATGRRSGALLLALAAIGLVPLAWM